MSTWHDTDRFWHDFHDVMFHRRRWEQAEEEADDILALAGIVTDAALLDMCCGPGRHALAFARRGLTVTGVDRTETYISQAQDRASEAGIEARFVVGDARAYREPERYDAAVCLYTSFGYFEDPEDDLLLLKNVCDSLKSGGVFVIDMNGKEVSARAFKGRAWDDLEDGSRLLEHRTVVPDWEWIENEWVLLKDGEQTTDTFRVRMYSGVELKQVLGQAGFGSVSLHGDWSGTPYDDHARRLIAVARK